MTIMLENVCEILSVEVSDDISDMGPIPKVKIQGVINPA
jgi:hypothetical protein